MSVKVSACKGVGGPFFFFPSCLIFPFPLRRGKLRTAWLGVTKPDTKGVLFWIAVSLKRCKKSLTRTREGLWFVWWGMYEPQVIIASCSCSLLRLRYLIPNQEKEVIPILGYSLIPDHSQLDVNQIQYSLADTDYACAKLLREAWSTQSPSVVFLLQITQIQLLLWWCRLPTWLILPLPVS